MDVDADDPVKDHCERLPEVWFEPRYDVCGEASRGDAMNCVLIGEKYWC
jgi:hypothetical protein